MPMLSTCHAQGLGLLFEAPSHSHSNGSNRSRFTSTAAKQFATSHSVRRTLRFVSKCRRSSSLRLNGLVVRFDRWPPRPGGGLKSAPADAGGRPTNCVCFGHSRGTHFWRAAGGSTISLVRSTCMLPTVPTGMAHVLKSSMFPGLPFSSQLSLLCMATSKSQVLACCVLCLCS